MLREYVKVSKIIYSEVMVDLRKRGLLNMLTPNEAAELIQDYLDKEDWNYEFNMDGDVPKIVMGLNLKSKLQSTKIYIFFNSTGYSVYSVVTSIKATDDEAKVACAEYLARANYGLTLGNFEFDCDDGEVRYKVHMPYCNDLPEEVIERSILIPPSMLDKYGNGLVALMMGFSNPKDEITKAES